MDVSDDFLILMERQMKIALWIYSIAGTLYFTAAVLEKATGGDFIEQHATGMLWLLMISAPFLLLALIGQIVLPRIAK